MLPVINAFQAVEQEIGLESIDAGHPASEIADQTAGGDHFTVRTQDFMVKGDQVREGPDIAEVNAGAYNKNLLPITLGDT